MQYNGDGTHKCPMEPDRAVSYFLNTQKRWSRPIKVTVQDLELKTAANSGATNAAGRLNVYLPGYRISGE
jgi:hypothetical protein